VTASGTSASFCVGVMPLQQGDERGQPSLWEVGAWAEGGNVPDAEIVLQSSLGAGAATFSFGCGSSDGTSDCDLGTVDSSSAQRLFQAEVTVPATATAVTAAGLTVTGSAAGLTADPVATYSIGVVSSAASATFAPAGASSSLPAVGAPLPSASPGASVANLFPTIAPGSRLSTPVADVTGLSSGAGGSEVAEATGLVALAAAMFLAITRLSFRRPVPRHAASPGGASAPPPPGPAAPVAPPEH
jgi:hypothetical protein